MIDFNHSATIATTVLRSNYKAFVDQAFWLAWKRYQKILTGALYPTGSSPCLSISFPAITDTRKNDPCGCPILWGLMTYNFILANTKQVERVRCKFKFCSVRQLLTRKKGVTTSRVSYDDTAVFYTVPILGPRFVQ